MADAPHCPDCGKPLAIDAPEELCPACLLKLALGGSAVLGEASPSPTEPPTEPLPTPGAGPKPAEAETRPRADAPESRATIQGASVTDATEMPQSGVVR